MAVRPLVIPPTPAADNAFDFSPLARLGQINRPQNSTLAGLGNVYGATANVPQSISPQSPGYVPAYTSVSPTGGMIDQYLARIARNESAGEKNPYQALGIVIPKTGDRAYGKYQIMGNNIPEWTQAALGRSMTPTEFLANPEAQEATARHRLGYYVQKYGPEGAAKAWLAGEGGMNNPNAADPLGTTTTEYARRFNAPLGDQ